jgi:ribonuclease BN (tRNA processing enzyme)
VSGARVRFLGSGDALGSGGRFQACIHVQCGPAAVLLDCGASSLIAMKRDGVDPSVVDAVLVSHLHGDHFGGLPFLILDGQFSRRTRPLTLAGPPGIEERVQQAREVLFPGPSKVALPFAVEFVELAEREPASLADMEAVAYPAVHASGAPAYAYSLLCGDKVIAYSGDTEWTDALVEAADGADLFICEAYFFDKRVKFHLDYATLMSHRDELRCKRLVLTHLNADMLARLPDVEAEVAHDALVIEL